MTASDPGTGAGPEVALTEWTACGGCAAKWGGAPLSDLVRQLAERRDPALLVGLAPFDDAAVYRISGDAALVSTTDFFPPLVDDPADFGAIAAANACSDVFAMGARVVLALNVAAFPEALPEEVIAEVFGAAAATVADAGGTVAGGHTIRSEEPIFGLAVQGVVHPDRILTKAGARPGDALLLSKPVGTGVVLAGADDAQRRLAIAGMRSLSRASSEALVAAGGLVHATTDVTGYGLLGHAWEVADRSGVRLSISAAAIPLYDGALAAAEAGTRTGGDVRNRRYVAGHVTIDGAVPSAVDVLAHDPQTSGGLLATVAPAAVDDLLAAGFVQIGEVSDGPEVDGGRSGPGVDLRP